VEQPKIKKQKDIFVGYVGSTVDKAILVGKILIWSVLVKELLPNSAAPAFLPRC